MGLRGEVSNSNEGVDIRVDASADELARFVERLRRDCPAAGRIDSVASAETASPETPYVGFVITPSKTLSDRVTRVSPDIAVCDACLADMEREGARKDFPFVNCTHCGPRFTIIEALPYDRAQTSMREFAMCPACAREYGDVGDRRFHAQPTACRHCGPRYELVWRSKEAISRHESPEPRELFARLAACIGEGNVVAMKGLGGYNLVCDARSLTALTKMREAKERDRKPFAVMFRSVEAAERELVLSDAEREALTSWRRPIVICAMRGDSALSREVNGGLSTVGALLPYLPTHYLLFKALGEATDALVFTSGNLHDEPITIDDAEAEAKLLPRCALLASHNRRIANRADDSIVQCIGEREQLLRRARGYTPEPLRLADTLRGRLRVDGILAYGAELTNAFALGKGDEVILSQYIGDLKEGATRAFLREAVERFGRLFRFEPRVIAADLHPDYASTRLAQEAAGALGVPLVGVQHHHAHAAAVLAELGIEGQRAALVLDGTGLGTDGRIWGSELLVASLSGFERIAHLPYAPLPGGDKAVREPWRTAVAMLDAAGVDLPEQLALHAGERLAPLRRMVAAGINAPLSCGAGRLFDAVAAMLGICLESTWQAEAPMRLEHLALQTLNHLGGRNYIHFATNRRKLSYDFDEPNAFANCYILNNVAREAAMLRGGEDEKKCKDDVSLGMIALRFHATLARQLAVAAERLCRERALPAEVILAGGCFQNRLLSMLVEAELADRALRPLTPRLFPPGDGAVALGQLAVAAARSQ
jgi:hydrogenase maturation protein HypF